MLQVRVENIALYVKLQHTLGHSLAHLGDQAYHVTITLVEQKNGKKREKQSQWQTHHPTLCPVNSWAKTVQRMREANSDPETNVVVYLEKSGRIN